MTRGTGGCCPLLFLKELIIGTRGEKWGNVVDYSYKVVKGGISRAHG